VSGHGLDGIFNSLAAYSKKVMMETLTSIKRAGAGMILTYFAVDAAKELSSR